MKILKKQKLLSTYNIITLKFDIRLIFFDIETNSTPLKLVNKIENVLCLT